MSQTEPTIKGMRKNQLIELIRGCASNLETIRSSAKKAQTAEQGAEDSEKKINKTLEQDGEDGLLKQIEKSKRAIDKKIAAIKEAYGEICVDGDENESIKTQLNNLVKIFEKEKEKIEEFKKEIYGYSTQDESGETKKIEGLFANINSFHIAQQKKYGELYERIEKELLSGATTVILAKVFASKVEGYKFWGNLFGFSFIGLLLLIAVYYGAIPFYTEEVKNVNDVWLHRLPFLIFAFWLAIFLGNRRAENKKLEEAYKHKEVMARSFTGYKESIKDLDDTDKELLKIHMNNLLNTLNSDSSKFLDTQGEKHPFLDFFGKKNK